MPNEPEQPQAGGGAQDEIEDESADAEQDRPTVAPPFDPVAFAREVLARPSPSQGTASQGGAGAPPATSAAPPASAHSRATPQATARPSVPTLTDAAELEEARQRSMTPQPPAPASGDHDARRRATPGGALSLANARVPSSLPPRPGESEAPERGNDGLATRPPPPLQQELIDSLARGEAPPSTKQAPAAIPDMALRSMPAPAEAPPSEQEMNDRVSLGDYTGALDIAEKLLETDPGNAAVKTCAEECRVVLRQMYAARIGALDRVPLVMVPRDQLRWLSIDHRAGFVLSLVDGVSSLEMILDVSGMPELDALRILSELVQQRIISFR